MKCPYCKGEHADQARFCPVTGQSLDTVPGQLEDSQPGPARIRRRSTWPIRVLILIGVLLIAAGGILLWNPPSVGAFPVSTQPVGVSLTPERHTETLAVQQDSTPFTLPSGATVTPFPTNTLTPSSSSTPVSGTPWPACPNASYESRLQTGAFATVSLTPPLANNVRESAGIDHHLLGKIQPGELIKVLSGPECVEDWVWWKIQSQETGLTGWTSEGDLENYWLVPED